MPIYACVTSACVTSASMMRMSVRHVARQKVGSPFLMQDRLRSRSSIFEVQCGCSCTWPVDLGVARVTTCTDAPCATPKCTPTCTSLLYNGTLPQISLAMPQVYRMRPILELDSRSVITEMRL